MLWALAFPRGKIELFVPGDPVVMVFLNSVGLRSVLVRVEGFIGVVDVTMASELLEMLI